MNSSLPSWQVMYLAWKWSCSEYICRNEAVKRWESIFFSPLANESIHFISVMSTSVLFMTQFSMEVQKVRDFAFLVLDKGERLSLLDYMWWKSSFFSMIRSSIEETDEVSLSMHAFFIEFYQGWMKMSKEEIQCLIQDRRKIDECSTTECGSTDGLTPSI